MRELKIVGLDLDGKHIICEGDNPADKFKIRVDDRLRAALRGDGARVTQTHIDIEVTNMLSPKEIQARIRSGASVEQLAEANGVDIARVERFAHPVLLERSRAAELATAAHPVLTDGPAVLTLLESVTSSLVARGLNPDNCSWDAWRNEDGRWTVQLGWKAGRSDNIAHFRFCPGAHGGTVTAVDDAASELIDPNFDRPLRPVAAGRPTRFRRAGARAARARGDSGARTESRTDGTRPPRQASRAGMGRRAAGRALQRAALTQQGHRQQRNPRTRHADSRAEHQPTQHRRAPPAPQRRRQPAGRDEIQHDGEHRMHPDQPQTQHHDSYRGDRGDDPATVKPVAHGVDSSVTSRA